VVAGGGGEDGEERSRRQCERASKTTTFTPLTTMELKYKNV
jgi:hypothetical protein